MKLSPGSCPWAAPCHTGSEQGHRKAQSRRTGAQVPEPPLRCRRCVRYHAKERLRVTQ